MPVRRRLIGNLRRRDRPAGASLNRPGVAVCIPGLHLCLRGSDRLFQLGIRYTGASTAAILSTLEPITSVILGVLVLGELFTARKIAGCLCILLSVVLIAAAGKKR